MAKRQPRTERFEGGAAGLLRYHRALHLLMCCLLAAPLAAASIHGLWLLPGAGQASSGAFFLFLVAFSLLLLSSAYASSSMGLVVIYASDGGPAEKSARIRALWWSVVKIDFACCAGIAALLALLHALAGDLELSPDLQWTRNMLLALLSFYPLKGFLLADRHGLGSRWWLLGGFAYFIFCYALEELGGPLILLPHALGAALLLLGLCVQKQSLRSHLLANAFEAVLTAALILWLAVLVETGLAGFGWQAAAAMAAASAAGTLANHERIRRGLYTTDLEVIRRKSFAADKKSLLRMLNPLDKRPRYWKWVRLVLRTAPYAWLIALLSTAAAATFGLALL